VVRENGPRCATFELGSGRELEIATLGEEGAPGSGDRVRLDYLSSPVGRGPSRLRLFAGSASEPLRKLELPDAISGVAEAPVGWYVGCRDGFLYALRFARTASIRSENDGIHAAMRLCVETGIRSNAETGPKQAAPLRGACVGRGATQSEAARAGSDEARVRRRRSHRSAVRGRPCGSPQNADDSFSGVLAGDGAGRVVSVLRRARSATRPKLYWAAVRGRLILREMPKRKVSW
jgi:hypothetical protein